MKIKCIIKTLKYLLITKSKKSHEKIIITNNYRPFILFFQG